MCINQRDLLYDRIKTNVRIRCRGESLWLRLMISFLFFKKNSGVISLIFSLWTTPATPCTIKATRSSKATSGCCTIPEQCTILLFTFGKKRAPVYNFIICIQQSTQVLIQAGFKQKNNWEIIFQI